MNGKRMILFAVAAALLITVAVFVGVLILGGGQTAQVTLPEITESGDPSAETPENGTDGVVSAQVNRETVQAVIESLERPTSYHRTVETQLFWSGGSRRSQAELWQRGGLIRLDVEEGSSIKHLILTEDTLYIWYNDETGLYSAPLSELGGDLTQLAEEFSAVPGYERVLQLEPEQIQSASYSQLEGKDCIYVRAQTRDLDYIEEYYIEVETGLLLASAAYDGETLVYEMKAGTTELTAPEDALFCLPGEETPLTS